MLNRAKPALTEIKIHLAPSPDGLEKLSAALDEEFLGDGAGGRGFFYIHIYGSHLYSKPAAFIIHRISRIATPFC